jgi:hypothetical protein
MSNVNALAGSLGMTRNRSGGGGGVGPSGNGIGSGGPNLGQGQAGFFTAMTKVYIGDVVDHLESMVGSLDQFVATCDHLTDYVFVSLPVR